MCYKQKYKVVSLNLAHPVHTEYKQTVHLNKFKNILFCCCPLILPCATSDCACFNYAK